MTVVVSNAQAFYAPVAYLLAAIAFIAGLSLVPKAQRLERLPWLTGAGLLVAGVGVGFETLAGGTSQAVVVLVGILLAALVVGVLVGLRVALRGDVAIAPARLAFVPALVGAAVVLAATAEVLGTTGDGLVPPLVAAGFGVVAAGFGVVASIKGSVDVRATAFAALSTAFAGWATAVFGVAIANALFVVVGGLAGAAALSLARVAAKSAARGLPSLLFVAPTANQDGYTNVRHAGVDELAVVLKTAHTVLMVPGYGMSAAHAQHALEEVSALLHKRGTAVHCVVHPVAGCFPGQMNIALDEANVAHERLLDLEDAQRLVPRADVVLVVGANDTINAAAAADSESPLFGMPALDLSEARAVFVIKRSLRAGAAGVANPQFEHANNQMLLGDGKRVLQSLVVALKAGGAH